MSTQVAYNTIYLSPHLDDVALSCGGQISMQTAAGQSVLIVTIAAGDPPLVPLSEFARLLHDRWELVADTVARRRAEDMAACQILGADYLHWDIPDCIYRQHPVTGELLYLSRDAIFGEVHPAEFGLVDELIHRLANLPQHHRLLAPLTVGHHVDHQLTRLAAERCFGSGIWYYEDYPYVREAGALATVIPPASSDWQAHVIPLNQTAVQARVEAIAAFASQISTFFNGRQELEEQINNAVQAVGGERIWQRMTKPKDD